MSNSNQLLTDYVYLAEASYADFSSAYNLTSNTYIEDKVEKAIYETKENGGVEKPENFAILVTDNYTVVAHYKDRTDESSFSGTLFQNKRTGDINNFGVK